MDIHFKPVKIGNTIESQYISIIILHYTIKSYHHIVILHCTIAIVASFNFEGSSDWYVLAGNISGLQSRQIVVNLSSHRMQSLSVVECARHYPCIRVISH